MLSPLNYVLCSLVLSTSLYLVCCIKAERPHLLIFFFTIEASQSVFYSRRKCLSGADTRKPAYYKLRTYDMNCNNVVIHTWWIVGFDLDLLFSFVSYLATKAASVKLNQGCEPLEENNL